MKEKAYLMTKTRRCSSWLDFMLGFMQNLSSIIPREAVSFVFPRVLMFPETNKTNRFPWDLTLSVYYIYKR